MEASEEKLPFHIINKQLLKLFTHKKKKTSKADKRSLRAKAKIARS